MEKVAGARIADIDRKKYLVPGDLTGQKVIVCVFFIPSFLLCFLFFLLLLSLVLLISLLPLSALVSLQSEVNR